MRVLHVTPYFAPAFIYGGPPRSILGLCQALLKIGVNLEVFTTTANGDLELPSTSGDADNYEGVSVRYFPRTFPKRFFGAAGLARAVSSVMDRYDLLHIHGLWNAPAWVASQPARRDRLPYVISPRGMLEPGSLKRRSWQKRIAYLLMERKNLTHAAFLHATSVAEGQTLESYGFDSKIVVLPNGVDVQAREAVDAGVFHRRHRLDERIRLIVFLGRIHPIKRLDILARAFSQVLEQIPEARLIIAGPDADGYRKKVEPQFSRVAQSVDWIGEIEQSEKWKLLRDADLLVMCSDSENFGLSVVEAMASAVPVVVTRTCPWPKIAAAGCGFWVAQDSREIAQAICYILTHPAEARSMGERGRRLAESEFGWESIARGMAEHYAAAINNRKISDSTLSNFRPLCGRKLDKVESDK